MDEEQTNIEENINKFLDEFFDWNYPRKRILFDNLTNIYILISFLYRNMNKLEIEIPDFRNSTEASILEKERLIDGFYKSIGINFRLDDIIKNKSFNIIKTNKPEEATFFELTHGNNEYKDGHKIINVYNNGLITDSIFWVHEISHYRNQPENTRGEVNDILTELIAFTESFIYADYLENKGYKKEAHMFRIKEYHNLYNVIGIGYHAVKIYLIYLLYRKVSKENYKLRYKEEQGYDKAKDAFLELRKQNHDKIFTIIWYSIATMSLYNYKRYKEDNNYIEKLKELDIKINTDISLEDALKIIDIKLDEESLYKILDAIDNFRDRVINDESNNLVRNESLS